MLKLFRTKTFIKEYKKQKFTDKLYAKYVTFISILLNEHILPLESMNHKLKGEHEGLFEFHIGGDLLIIYRVKENISELMRIGTHSELFK